MPKDNRLDEILRLLTSSSQQALAEQLQVLIDGVNDLRVSFDHSMEFFESRLHSIDCKQGQTMEKVERLAATHANVKSSEVSDHDECSGGKVALLKSMFEPKPLTKIEK